MKRRLWLLNLLLAAAIAAGGVQLKKQMDEARAREAAVLARKAKPAPRPAAAPPAAPQPVQAAGYIDIAQQMLLARDRNPTVVVEAPPPPPKPMPPLPALFGTADFGDGTLALMTPDPKGRARPVRVGETIGEFKLVSIQANSLTLEWDGKKIEKAFREFSRPVREAVEASEGRPQVSSAPTVLNSAPTVLSPQEVSTPGDDMGAGRSACRPGDTSAPGTIVNGMKKVVVASPFNPNGSCWWEPVK